MASLEEVIEGIESRFPSKVGQPTSVCETGEEYQIVASDGIIDEGSARNIYPSAEAAIAAYEASFNEYAAGKSGKLYWRTKPEMMTFPVGGFSVYSRLLISATDELPDGHKLRLATYDKPLIEEVEFMARKFCELGGADPDAEVFRGHPMRVPSLSAASDVFFVPGPMARIPQWMLFYEVGVAMAMVADGKIKFSEKEEGTDELESAYFHALR